MFNNLIAFLANSRREIIPAKTTLFEEDQFSTEIILIVSGSIRIYMINEKGNEITLSIRGPDEIAGLYSLLLDEKHQANAQTLEETTIIKIKKKEFKELLKNQPGLTFELLSYLAYEIRQENKYIQRISQDDLKSRVWKTIRRIAKFSKEYTIYLSHEDISRIVGGTRARVTESLHKLENEGKIKIGQKKITVINLTS